MENIDASELTVARGFYSAGGFTSSITGDTDDLIRVSGFESVVSNTVPGKFFSAYHSGTAPSYFRAGVQFDTAAGASALSDYEEGSFTAEFINTGTSVFNYTENSGRYTIVGDVCTVSYFISWDSLTNASSDQLKLPLPFKVIGSTDGYRAAAAIGFL